MIKDIYEKAIASGLKPIAVYLGAKELAKVNPKEIEKQYKIKVIATTEMSHLGMSVKL
jgi:hypothetical protein